MSEASGFVYEEIPYRLVRSPRRKRVGLVMARNGVEVRIPQRCAAVHGHRFLQDNVQWVRAQLLRSRERAAQVPEYVYRWGEHFPWLGCRLPLERAARPGEAGTGSESIRVYTRELQPDPARLQAALHKLYQREALALLAQKSEQQAARLGLQPAAVRVRRTRSKWGHCTLRGELQYNWLICLAPEPVVDYLVAHEVSHMRHHNHSRAFWQLVEQLCPDYQHLRRWLRENGHRLVL
ncbi:M48 family metallopeptidase [Microbulbifer guangxiensis]|uniref:M48 family metallopeptidase n=1 Tax=Microbulbifer guangxiensis TaxID=2904249 RepID=UPI001F297A23|nr:SprT family zinc-dependent metalloprotease [Microbulbifer guangxiensis]